MRLQGGAIHTFDVLLDGVVVGWTSVRLNKKTRPWSETTTYGIGDRTFYSLAEFKAAIAANAERK